MKPAIAQPRSSHLVQAQLEEFEALMKDTPPPTADDFASELQWKAMKNHRAELEEELAQARVLEDEKSGRNFAFVETLLEKFRNLIGSTSARRAGQKRDAVTSGGEMEERSAHEQEK